MDTPSGLNRTIAPWDHMRRAANGASTGDHYFAAGASALRCCQVAATTRAAVTDAPVTDILDFGCGAGRVTRHLRAAWPDATIHVTDLRRKDVEWVVANLGAVAAPQPLPAAGFDLIWLGSVFTHLNPDEARGLLATLLPALRPNGVLVFSTQGRGRLRRLERWEAKGGEPPHGLTPSQAAELLAGYRASGYGFTSYPNKPGYGLSMASPEWYARAVFALADVRQVMAWERGLDDNQDVVGFINRGIGARQ